MSDQTTLREIQNIAFKDRVDTWMSQYGVELSDTQKFGLLSSLNSESHVIASRHESYALDKVLKELKKLSSKKIPRGEDIHPEYTKGFEEMQGKVKFELKRITELRGDKKNDK